MAQTYKTEGIVLRRWDYREQDRMVRLLTAEHGKITTRAISARKPKAKLAGHLEPFIETDLFIAHSKTIDIIAGSNTIVSNARLRESLMHNTLANFFVEIVDRFTEERDRDPRLYFFVRDFLKWLSKMKEEQLSAVIVYAAILQFFGLLGYHIDLYTCHQCHKSIRESFVDGQNKFLYALWNIECGFCTNQENVLSISDSAIKALRFLIEKSYHEAGRLSVTPSTWQEVDQFVRSLLHYHSDFDIRSEQVFIQLLQVAQV